MDNEDRLLFILILLLVPPTWGWTGLWVFLPMVLGICLSFDFYNWYVTYTLPTHTFKYKNLQ